MSLLAPFWFLLAGAAAIPLLLHLLRRRSGVRTEFPAARYLARAEREHSRSLRLRNLLLMLLRVFIALLLAFAAARPMARLGGWWRGDGPVALALVLDNSLSTSVVEGRQPMLETLRDTAELVLADAGDRDRVWIVTADGRVAGGSPAAARAALAAVRSLSGAGDLPAAVRVAGATVAGAGAALAARVVVLTDGQRTAWPRQLDVAGAAEYVLVTPGTTAPANRGVVTAAAQPQRWTPRGTLSVDIHTTDTVAFRVALLSGTDSRTIVRASFVPGEPQLLRVAPDQQGWVAGRVEIDPDEMPGDDVRWFAAWVGTAPGVAATPGAGAFVRSALEVLEAEGRAQDGGDIRLMSAHEVEGRGPILLMAPALSAQLGAANQALARRGIPWRLGALRPAGRLHGNGIGGIEVRTRYALVPTTGARVDTVASVDGEPWAVAGVTPGGPYVLVASPLVPDATALPVRAAFVPWLAKTLFERLAGGTGGIVEAAPGARVPMPAWADSLAVQGDDAAVVGGVEFTAPAAPGVHFFSRDGRQVGALVVNAEDSESVLARMDDREMTRWFGTRPPQLARTEAGWRRALFAGEGARALVIPALLAVLGLLLLELAATSVRARGTT